MFPVPKTYTVTVRSKINNAIVRVKHFSSADYYEANEYAKLVKNRYSSTFNVDLKIKMKKVKHETA